MNKENNILLSEFMQLVWDSNFSSYFSVETGKYWTKKLKFHKDWRCLMEVVQKIESIDNERFCFEISLSGATIEDMLNDFNTIVEIVAKTKIESVYLACVEFVKWYNQQNAKPC